MGETSHARALATYVPTYSYVFDSPTPKHLLLECLYYYNALQCTHAFDQVNLQ